MKDFVLAHFEKAILGLCALVMIYFLLTAVSIKPYEKTHETFAKVTTAAKANVANGKPEVDDLKPANIQDETQRWLKGVANPLQFALQQQWFRPFDFSSHFRGQPKVGTPKKPFVQDNRGLMDMYAFGADGKKRTRMVKRSEANRMTSRSNARGGGDVAGRMSGFGRGYGGGAYSPGGSSSTGRYGNSGGGYPGSGSGGGGYPGGAGGYPGSGSDTSSGMDSGSQGPPGGYPGGGYPGGGEGMTTGRGMAIMGDDGGGPPGGNAPGEGLDDPNAGAAPVVAPVARKGFLLGGPKEAKGDKAKDPKQDELVPEFIERREGQRWVELVASFDHQDQIREYVKALKESALTTNLRYALAEVQRRERNKDMTYGDWTPINMEVQFNIVQNAIEFEPETSPVVLPGLAMVVPKMIVFQRQYLHTTLEDFKQSEKAVWSPEDLDPYLQERMADAVKQVRRRNPNAPPEQVEQKKAEIRRQFLQQPGAGAGRNNLGLKAVNAKGRRGNNNEVKSAMIRFWDFTVEPDRHYQYRVRVRVQNPNDGRSDVADPSFALKPLLAGDWSEASDDVYVEADTAFYAANDRPTRLTGAARVEVHHWYKNMGEWLVDTFEQRPGETVGLSAGAKDMRVLDWNDTTRKFVVKKRNLAEQFDSNHVLVSATSGLVKLEYDERVINLRPQREFVVVDEDGNVRRRVESLDAADPKRKAITDNYTRVLVPEIDQLDPEAARKAKEDEEDGEDPAAPKGGKKGRGKGKNKGGRGGSSGPGAGGLGAGGDN